MLAALPQKLVSHSNQALSLLHRIVPNPLQNQFVLYQVNTLAQEFIDNDELDFLEGKIAKFEITDVGASWFFSFDGKKLNMINQDQNQADNSEVCFSANTKALVLLASQKVDPDTLFFNRDLQITGDTELGLEIKNLIDLFDISKLNGVIRFALDKWSDLLIKQSE